MISENILVNLQAKHDSIRTNFSMDNSALHFILEQIEDKRFQNILEFGSGLSTIYLAEIIKELSLNTKINSVESDPYWLDKIFDQADKYNLTNYINFIYAPVFPDQILGDKNKWYDTKILDGALKNHQEFDFVIIDGPIAYHHDIELSRYGALPYVFPKLADKFMILLDDCHRTGEQQVLQLWLKDYGLTFDEFNGRFAVCYYSK